MTEGKDNLLRVALRDILTAELKKSKKDLKKWVGDSAQQLQDFVEDVITLDVVTTVDKEKLETHLYLDGDIDVEISTPPKQFNKQVLKLHKDMVELAMKNRLAILKIVFSLLDIKTDLLALG